jgi:hypothetical protein
MGEMGGGWWDSFRREMLKRRWIGDQSLEDSDSSDSSEVPEVPEVSKPFLSHCMQGKDVCMQVYVCREGALNEENEVYSHHG